jgi:hypothetical protein
MMSEATPFDLSRLEFRLEAENGLSTLSVAAKGSAKSHAPVILRATGNQINSSLNLPLYGVLDRPYTDWRGVEVQPVPVPVPPQLRRDASSLFVELYGRGAGTGEINGFLESIRNAATSSPIVRSWGEGVIDFDALHALPYDNRGSELMPLEHYNWLAEPTVGAQAVKRFVLTHPILAGIAMNGSELFEVAEGHVTPEAAYEAILSSIETVGFTGEGGGWKRKVGPISRDILARLADLPQTCATFDDEDLFFTTDWLSLARRLLPSSLPSSKVGLINLAEAGRCVEGFTEKLSVRGALEEGDGFGFQFSNAEIQQIFRNVDFDKALGLITTLDMGGAPFLGAYGALLEERWDLVREPTTDADGFAFSALREALLRDGFVSVSEKAKEAVLEFEGLSSPRP